jgi:hypothetical protein
VLKKFFDGQLIYLFFVILIIVCSFFIYSSCYSPILGSDDAVSILMLHDLHIPEDLYFWGQDRYGSLIPVLGQVFYKTLNISAVAAESFTHYLLLILGYFGFSTFFKSKISKMIFAIIWFFPPLRMIDLLRFNLGLEYCMLGISLALLTRLDSKSKNKSVLVQHLLFFTITMLFIILIWVSELAIISISILLLVLLYNNLKGHGFSIKHLLKVKIEYFYIIGGAIVGILFIDYAKSHSVRIDNYDTTNDFATIINSIQLFFHSIIEFFAFKAGEPFTSVYACLVTSVALFCLINFKKFHAPVTNKKWLAFFLLDSLLVLVVIMSSKWSYLNEVPRRYFIPLYISGWMFFLLSLEDFQIKLKAKQFLNVLCFLTVLIGGLGTIYNLKYISPKSLTPKIEIAGEFKKLGNIGIIADYWNSYIIAVVDPDNIKATPHESAGYRNLSFAKEAFNQKSIYVIKDSWLETFPDSLTEFGHLIKKDGAPFHTGDCDVCKYWKVY